MFKKAEKTQSKLWCAIYGTSGSGKTISALRIATGMGGKMAVIDSERGSASKYADRFTFDTLILEDKTIKGYTVAIEEAKKGGYEILVIDSMSHAWQELLEEIEQLAKQKYQGNIFRAWAEGTPKQRDFIDTILNFPGHVIVTMRSKTEWGVDTDEKGKMKPRKLGLAPEQGKNIEYEFDLLLVLNDEHVAKVEKDRTGKYQDAYITKPGEDFGKELIAWLKEGKPVEKKEPVKNDNFTPEFKKYYDEALPILLKRINPDASAADKTKAFNDYCSACIKDYKPHKLEYFTLDEIKNLCAYLKGMEK